MRSAFAFLLLALATVTSEKTIDGYSVNESNNKGYKIMYSAKPWGLAREHCAQQGGMLAVPTTEEEFKFVQNVVRGMLFKNITNSTGFRLLAWLGVSNLEDFTQWKTVDGVNINDTSFNRWAGNNGISFSADPRQPHCVGIDARNDGYRHFWCDKHQPYVCQKKF